MSHCTRFLTISVFTAVLSIGNLAQAQEFSADFVNTTRDGVMTGKIYAAKDKFKMEFLQGSAITRMDKNVVWVLMPEQKMYMEQKVDPSALAQVGEKLPGETERINMGTEIVDGRPATKYKITNVIDGVRSTTYQWIDNGLQVPVKTEAEDKSWRMEYKNIKAGPQSPFIFEVPIDYKKFSMDIPMGNMPSPSDMGY